VRSKLIIGTLSVRHQSAAHQSQGLQCRNLKNRDAALAR
jgi:hypothetical protein